MNDELLLSIKKHIDTLIEQTIKRAQKSLEYKINEQRQLFSFIAPKYLVEEEKWLLAVRSLEVTNSVFNITSTNKSLSITIPGHLDSECAETAIGELNKLFDLRSGNDIKLQVKQARKKG